MAKELETVKNAPDDEEKKADKASKDDKKSKDKSGKPAKKKNSAVAAADTAVSTLQILDNAFIFPPPYLVSL